ncbi:UDP-Glycosyltransferase glycogen phosphorylase [Pyrrhoderma noxium]|uniref:UDP-Glycosyltransferase glycogen phosphorylase n=1 Tax=Pyrrhoderma noxium TaxID=2282107 RepID=A0A286UBA5_9AGAM|nr:UDP-Glycosyltransferase glycogen phosphorylase [Pyrrhoderma noxium]
MNTEGHIITLTILAWGHAKSVCALIVPFFEKANKEVDAQFSKEEANLRKRIRVVGLYAGESSFDLDSLSNSFISEYRKLLASEPVRVTPDSTDHYDVVIPPKLLILDYFLPMTLNEVRSISGKDVLVYSRAASAGGILFMFGPEELGGNGDLAEKIKKIETHDEKEKAKEADKLYRRCYGNLINLAGRPPMYDYEHVPQEPILDQTFAFVSANVHKFFNDSDGVVLNTTPIFEEPAITAFKSCEKREGQFPRSPGMIYISFGTIYWFKNPEKFWVVLEEIVQAKIPFIFSIASPFASIPDEIKERISQSGIGLLSSWVPQTDVLSHEACGWFFTHAGQNSSMESLSTGVPMICCPFDADQPAIAACLSSVHNVAYELFELRSGHGLKPIHRLRNRAPEGTIDSTRKEIKEVLALAYGPDGEEKRRKARVFQHELEQGWSSINNGSSWKEIAKITEVL